jgi:hypothetical protein
VDDGWVAGRIWARTGCVVQNGVFQCLTGGCGAGTGGDVTWCVVLLVLNPTDRANAVGVFSSGTDSPPATLGVLC